METFILSHNASIYSGIHPRDIHPLSISSGDIFTIVSSENTVTSRSESGEIPFNGSFKEEYSFIGEV